MIAFAGIFVVAFIASWMSVNATLYFARQHSILDIPNERSSHTKSVPRGGGLAIVAVTLAGLWLYSWQYPTRGRSSILAYTVGALLVAIVSWLDDLRSQPKWARLLVHSIAAAVAIFGIGGTGGILSTFGPSLFGILGVIITLFWIVGLTNAYNFMDGIDGIAGGQAVIAGLAWAIFGGLQAQPVIVVLGLLLAASSLGFLFHNWSPARIFMGDVGATFLGYTFAVLPLLLGSMVDRERHWLTIIALGVLPVWPFVFDTSFTFLRRVFHGEHVFRAHRSHLYQRLVILDYPHAAVSLLYSGLAVLGSLLLLPQQRRTQMTTIALPLLCLFLWALVIWCEAKRRARLSLYSQSAALETPAVRAFAAGQSGGGKTANRNQ